MRLSHPGKLAMYFAEALGVFSLYLVATGASRIGVTARDLDTAPSILAAAIMLLTLGMALDIFVMWFPESRGAQASNVSRPKTVVRAWSAVLTVVSSALVVLVYYVFAEAGTSQLSYGVLVCMMACCVGVLTARCILRVSAGNASKT